MGIEQYMRDYSQLTGIGDFVANLVEHSSCPCHLKDAQTGKYLQSNYHSIKKFGLESVDDLIGLTAKELLAESGLWQPNLGASIMAWKNREIKMVDVLECQVRATKRPLGKQCVYCGIDGSIRLESVIKLPIPDHESKKIIAILTLAQDITLQVGLFKLFALYREYHPEKQAIQLLLRFLRLNTYFTELPTLKEIEILFAMRQDPRHKCVAKLLNSPLGTVSCYIQKLREKLSIDLYNLVAQLRALPVDERKAQGEYAVE